MRKPKPMPKSQRDLALAAVEGLRRLKQAVAAGQIDLHSKNFKAIMALMTRWDKLQTARGFTSIFSADSVRRHGLGNKRR